VLVFSVCFRGWDWKRPAAKVRTGYLLPAFHRASGLIQSFSEDHSPTRRQSLDTGGEIIRDLNYTPSLRKVTAQRLLREAVHAHGGPLIHTMRSTSLVKDRAKEEHHVRRKKTNPVISAKEVQDLIKSGKMPTPEQFLQAMVKAREEYVPKLKKLREKEKQN
jgi:hypothetical protein